MRLREGEFYNKKSGQLQTDFNQIARFRGHQFFNSFLAFKAALKLLWFFEFYLLI